MDTKEIINMMEAVCEMAINSRAELCRLDAYVGDGDHGYTVERGFQNVKNMLEEQTLDTPKAVFEAVGDELADTMGGAIGLIIGGLFRGGSEAMEAGETVGVNDLYVLLQSGLEEIKLVGGAKEGDRTLVDALSPACDAYKAAMESGADLKECFRMAADAAEAGAESTVNMIAKKGRAKFLGEESLGHIDAGAATMSKIIRAMSNYINS